MPCMQINDLDQFDVTILCILAMNIITSNLKENVHWVVELFPFYNFHIKPRPLISKRGITKKINSAQLDHMNKLLTKFDIDRNYSF